MNRSTTNAKRRRNNNLLLQTIKFCIVILVLSIYVILFSNSNIDILTHFIQQQQETNDDFVLYVDGGIVLYVDDGVLYDDDGTSTDATFTSSSAEVITTTSSTADTFAAANTSAPIVQTMKLKECKNFDKNSPIFIGGCCGIGHRLSRNIPMYNFAYQQSRVVYVMWFLDVSWNALFNDTDCIKDGMKKNYTHDPILVEMRNNNIFFDSPFWYGNGFDYYSWYTGEKEAKEPLPKFKSKNAKFSTVLLRYRPHAILSMDKPEIWAYLVMLRDSLSPLVLSFLDSIRIQMNENERIALEEYLDEEGEEASETAITTYNSKTEEKDEEENYPQQIIPSPPPKHHAKICSHIRQGNNETGDWQGKTWRHIDTDVVLSSLRDAMKEFSQNSKHVSIFIASDNRRLIQEWFESNKPSHWKIVKSDKEVPMPENGVWFGAHGSETSKGLSQEQKNVAMAEGVSEIFALGECDALFIPNYSTFSIPGITLSRARRKSVFFRKYIDPDEERKVLEIGENVLTQLWSEMSSLIESPPNNVE